MIMMENNKSPIHQSNQLKSIFEGNKVKQHLITSKWAAERNHSATYLNSIELDKLPIFLLKK